MADAPRHAISSEERHDRPGTMSIVLPSLLENPIPSHTRLEAQRCVRSHLSSQLQLVLVLQHILDGHASFRPHRPSIPCTTG